MLQVSMIMNHSLLAKLERYGRILRDERDCFHLSGYWSDPKHEIRLDCDAQDEKAYVESTIKQSVAVFASSQHVSC